MSLFSLRGALIKAVTICRPPGVVARTCQFMNVLFFFRLTTKIALRSTPAQDRTGKENNYYSLMDFEIIVVGN